MNSKNKLHFMRQFFAVLLLLPTFLLSFSSANAAEFCSDSFYINETLANGSKWDMCWEHRQREGIVLHHIRYTPKNGSQRIVLNQASVAQIHVPYDDNGARYHDISDYGIGGSNMLDLETNECPSGTLLKFSGKDVLCKQIKRRDFAYKSGGNTSSGNSLELFSVSPVGAYFYIPTWKFMDDGTIEPWIGATGALQRYGSNQSRGWLLGDNRIGISHLHNFFWRLDFDLNTTHLNDVVEELNFPLVNGKRQRTTTTFNSEAARKVNPDTMRRWRVRDNDTKNSNNHSISYDIVLAETSHQDIGPASEPFTHNDFYVTKHNNGEKFASHNPSGGNNLAEFVNGESITNKDTVIWTGVTFYHMPRAEDAPHMDAHWSHMQIIPRDWHASNPLAPANINSAPTISAPGNQASQTGNGVNLAIQATDADGDTLSYSASNLPSGLGINSSTGVISGTPSSNVNRAVTVSVNDGQESTSVQFNWVVTTVVSNSPPQITSINNRSGNIGDNVSLAVQASDPDGDAITFSATGLPSGLQINSSTGLISGTLTTVGNYSVTAKASDATSNTTMQFTWNVTTPAGSTSNQVSNSAITVNGSLNDWNGLTYFANDPDDINGVNNQIDWLKAAVAHSPQKVFFAYQNRQNVDPDNNSGNYIPWGWQAYIDTDSNTATGYQQGNIGADYLVEGGVLQRYTGTGTSWSWQVVQNATVSYSGNTAELSFSRASLGNPQNARFIFVGANSAFSGTAIDVYPESGFFSYAFTGTSNPNTAPVANNQQVSVGSGASVSVVLTATDIDNDPLSFQVTQQPVHGSLSGSAPNLVYTANSQYTGADSFKFQVNDGSENSQVATVNITVTSGQNNGAISNFVSNPINIDGNASDWSGLSSFAEDGNDVSGSIDWRKITVAHDNAYMFLLYNSWNNIDPNSTSGTYLAWGWQVFIDSDKNIATGYQTGVIGADFVIEGTQIQRYTGSGSNWSWQSIGSVTSRYSGNIAELALPRSQIGNVDSVRVVVQGDSSAYQGTSADFYPNGQNESQSSLRYFDYDFTGDGGGSNTRPIAYAQTVSVNQDGNVDITLLGTDSDNNSLVYNVAASPLHGTLTGTAPNLTYTPDTAYVGQDSFTFNVNDGLLESATVTVTININGSNTGVISNLVSGINVDGNNQEWSSLTAFPNDGNDISGANNIIDWNKATIAHSATSLYMMYQNHGSVNPDDNSGSYINWGWQSFLDTDNNASTGYSIGNIGADFVIEGTQLQRYTGNNNSWSWQVVNPVSLNYNANVVELGFARGDIGNPSELKVIFVGANGAFNGTTSDQYPNDLQAFEYQLSGGNQRQSNRPVTNNQSINVLGNSQAINLSANDEDNDALSFRIIEQPSNGILVATNESGSGLMYQANENYTGSDSFRFIANDGTFDSSVNTVTLNNIVVEGASSGSGNNGSSGGGGSIHIQWLILLALAATLIRRRSY